MLTAQVISKTDHIDMSKLSEHKALWYESQKVVGREFLLTNFYFILTVFNHLHIVVGVYCST